MNPQEFFNKPHSQRETFYFTLKHMFPKSRFCDLLDQAVEKKDDSMIQTLVVVGFITLHRMGRLPEPMLSVMIRAINTEYGGDSQTLYEAFVDKNEKTERTPSWLFSPISAPKQNFEQN